MLFFSMPSSVLLMCLSIINIDFFLSAAGKFNALHSHISVGVTHLVYRLYGRADVIITNNIRLYHIK